MLERIDLHQADDPRDVIHRAVACLARGGLVALATDSGYGVVVSVFHPDAVIMARRGVDSPTSPAAPAEPPPLGSATLLLKSHEELADWVDLGSSPGQRLPARVWPGPVILRCRPVAAGLMSRLAGPVADLVVAAGQVDVQVPADRILREILRFSPGPLLQINRPGDGSRRADLGEVVGLSMIIDSGELPPRQPPSTVEISEAGWSVARPGLVPERVLEEWASRIILFVCTGNTCRSPMAEALCKAVLARRLGCSVDDLVGQGYLVVSAGVAASAGMPAAAHAVEVVGSRGGSLVEHSSRQVTPDLVRHADHILAMTWDHLDALLDEFPGVSDRVRLLDPSGGDVADPVGLDLATYHETAREIERHLDHFFRELDL